jgi:hypothetical protein
MAVTAVTGIHHRAWCPWAAPAAMNAADATHNGANAERCRNAHRVMITMTSSGSGSPELITIMGCIPARRA